VLYEEVIDNLVAISQVETPRNSLLYFNPMLKMNEVPDGFHKK
jgi:hypothetical protein